MSIQSSGQISMSDIRSELGLSGEVGLRDMSDTAGFSTPDAISEFYGYLHNQYYRDFAEDSGGDLWRDTTTPITNLSSGKISFSLWIRPNWAATDVNTMIIDITPQNAANTNNRLFLQYDYGFNRFIFRYRSNAVNFDRQWALHSNSSVTGTGASSSNKWTGANRGNTNADGFVHLVGVYDGSQSTGTNAFDLYWNGTALPTEVASNSGTRTNFNKEDFAIASTYNSTGDRDVDIDMVQIWSGTALTSTNATTLYNSGSIIDAEGASLTTNLVFESSFEDATPVDAEGNFTIVRNSGSRTSY